MPSASGSVTKRPSTRSVRNVAGLPTAFGADPMPKFTQDPVIQSEPENPESTEEPKTLDEIAADTGVAHTLKTESEALLKTLKKEFFDAATAQIDPKSLATKTVAIPTSVPVDDSKAFALKYNPGWVFVEQRAMPNGSVRVIIQEDPAFRSFSHVVRVDDETGYHVSRSVASGSVLVDDERLKVEDKRLYEEVTYVPMYDALTDMLSQDDRLTAVEIDARIQEYVGDQLTRTLVSLKDLTPKQQRALKPYMYEGPKQARLLVRTAKESELAGL